MVTERQIEANRKNALKSTGPRTGAGKARSSRNATRHGILAETVVPECEDGRAFTGLVSCLFADFDPQTEFEAQLVEKLAVALWRDRRLAKAEQVQMQMTYNGWVKPPFFREPTLREKYGIPTEKTMLLLGRYQVMITNEIARILAMLRSEQERRLRDLELTADPVEPE